MIEQLTKEQRKRLAEFRDECFRIGIATGPVEVDKVAPVFRELYRRQQVKPVEVLRVESPTALGLSHVLPKTLILSPQWLGGGPWAREAAWKEVSAQTGGAWNEVADQLWDPVVSRVWSTLWHGIYARVPGWLRMSLADTRSCGHCELLRFGFFRFMEELGCRLSDRAKEDVNQWEILSRHCGPWWPCTDVVLAMDRPVDFHWSESEGLHNATGPAMAFAGEDPVYALHGIHVPEWLVMTPREKLDAREILKIRTVDQRREGVRKLGIEGLVQQLGAKRLDSEGDYELLSLELGDRRVRPYLKMRNPSLGVWHVEGVHPDCRTVKEALKWRNSSELRPHQLT